MIYSVSDQHFSHTLSNPLQFQGKRFVWFFMKTAPFSKPKEAVKAINSVKTTLRKGTLCWSNERYEDRPVKGWTKIMPRMSKKTLSIYLSIFISHFFGLSKALQTKSRVSLFIWDAVCHSDTLRNWHLQFSHVRKTVTWTDKINCCSHTPTDFVMSLKPQAYFFN